MKLGSWYINHKSVCVCVCVYVYSLFLLESFLPSNPMEEISPNSEALRAKT